MNKYKIIWSRKQFGETTIKADNKSDAEEKAETGKHEKVKSISNDFEDWIITDIKKIK